MKGGFLTTEVLTTPLLFQVVLEGRIPNNRGVELGIDDILIVRGTCPKDGE